jgi:23S rRNA (guanosine2251-2'-O)-methyltransferase
VAGEALYGLNPVQRALASGRRTVRRLYLREGRPSERLTQLARQAEGLGLSVYTGTPEELEALCGSSAHQGAVLACSPLPLGDEAAALALPVADRPVLLVLDQVEDPQNLGAVVRNAAAFGAAGLVIPRHHAAPLSPAASKASAGELETFPVFEVTNLARFLDACKERGYWVAGTVVEGGAPLAGFRRETPVVLVLGSEGRGMRPLVERHCDFRLTIPTRAGTSLNVSAASAIALHHLLGAAAMAVAAKDTGIE